MSNETETMKKKSKRTLTPKLRFPEFNGSPLHPVRLGDVTAESMIRNGNGVPLTSVMGVRKDEGIVPMEERLVASDISRYKLVEKDWFAYNPMRLNIGSIARSGHDSNVLVSPDYVVFRCLEEGVSPGLSCEYLDHFRESDQWDAFVTEAGDGGVRVRIYYRDIAKLWLTVPDIDEQQKIAECLSSLDELMAAEGRKLAALRDHKRGLMQQLFPQPGQTQPRLRFPEFKDDWVLKKGGEITTKITKGSSPSWQGFSYQSEGVLFITSENVRDGFIDVCCPKYLPKEFYEKQKNSQLSYGDILINIVGASIGRNCLYLLEDEAFTNQAVALFRVDNKNSFEFINYCYQHDGIQKAVFGSQSDSARPNLSLTDLREIEFILPSLKEQQKIADCLIALDAQITAQAAKIETLKQHKRGLMQQLFPAPEEQ